MLLNFPKPKPFEKDWPLTGSPVPVYLILLTYVLFVFKFGKIFMQNRKPYNVKNIMLVYNALQVVINLILCSYCFTYIFIKPVYDIRCMVTLPSGHPIKLIEQTITYGFCTNKILDLADTIFFVLRKSYKQVTLLHVYHHIGMVFGGYVFMRFYGSGGHFCLMSFLNTFVHVVMYSYYFLSALSPRVRNALWWKRYITIIQMLQFIIIFLHTLYVMVVSTDCTLPRFLLWVGLTQSATMMVMFTQFYVKAYIIPKTQNHVQKEHKPQDKQK